MQTFHKSEKLVSRKTISSLFQKNKGITCYPYKILWQKEDLNTKFPAQICITVPKRSFKKAHDRNYIKRKIREAYRKNKSLLYTSLQEKNINVAILLIYVGKEDMDSVALEKKMIQLIQQLNETIA